VREGHYPDKLLAYNQGVRRHVLASLLCLAACGGSGDLTVEPTTMPPGTDVIPLGEVALESISYSWKLRAESAVDRPLKLSARFDGAVPPGATLKLDGETSLLPRAAGFLHLVFGTPREIGPFSATLRIECAELPGWSRKFRVHGTMARLPLEGQVLRIKPAGVDLGACERGERRPFSVALENAGSEQISVHDWSVDDPERLRLENALPNEILEPGATFELRGVCIAPPQVGRFEVTIRLLTNIKVGSRREIRVTGVVEAAYETLPDRLQVGQVHPPEAPLFTVRVRGRPEAAPIVVTEVAGLDPYFELAAPLGAEPAREQSVRLRVRRDAPHGTIRGHRLRFHLGPVDDTVECPVEGRVIPSLLCDPARLDFGRIGPGSLSAREITIWHHANRPFRVTAVRCRSNLFIVEAIQLQGLPPRVRVSLPPRASGGVLRDVIEVETDDPETPGIHVPVSAQVEP